ncbi:hemicentin-1-like [Anguilla rostrata]|uniref:hemicentin-1-like n=1 Tax=Anguilla rostrata TaxID=7938 RepID=UPI0030CC862B
MTDGSSFTISSAALAHSGEYRCRAARGRKPFYSVYSDPLTLEISEVFHKETVTLMCVIQGSSTEWKYKWYRDGRELPVDKADSSSVNGDTYTILSADQSHAGLYTCRGELTRRASVHSQVGSSANLSVRGNYDVFSKPLKEQNAYLKAGVLSLPQAQLTVQSGWTDVFPTETVTLRCVIQGSSTEWMYKWYRDGRELPVDKADSSSVNGDTYTILSADQSHAGLYTCRGELTRRASVHSLIGSSAKLSVRVLPQTYLIVQSGWTEVFPNETVTLRCVIQGSSTEWKYKWYRDGRELPVDKANSSSVNGDTYTILSADQSHAGLYTCRGELTRTASVHSLIGSSATLTVRGKYDLFCMSTVN